MSGWHCMLYHLTFSTVCMTVFDASGDGSLHQELDGHVRILAARLAIIWSAHVHDGPCLSCQSRNSLGILGCHSRHPKTWLRFNLAGFWCMKPLEVHDFWWFLNEAYMMGDLYKKNTCLDFPKGGNEALVDALVRGIEKHPGGKGAGDFFFADFQGTTDNHRYKARCS